MLHFISILRFLRHWKLHIFNNWLTNSYCRYFAKLTTHVNVYKQFEGWPAASNVAVISNRWVILRSKKSGSPFLIFHHIYQQPAFNGQLIRPLYWPNFQRSALPCCRSDLFGEKLIRSKEKETRALDLSLLRVFAMIVTRPTFADSFYFQMHTTTQIILSQNWLFL